MSLFNLAAGAAIGYASASMFPITRLTGVIGGITVSVLLSKSDSDELMNNVRSLAKVATKIFLAVVVSALICSSCGIHAPLPYQMTHAISKMTESTKNAFPFVGITTLVFLVLFN